MKKLITIFEKTENVHLTKDVGQIAYHMHKVYNYDSTILTYKNMPHYNSLKKELQGLNLKFLPRIRIGRYSLSIIYYIITNAKKIDFLYTFHHKEKSYLYLILYKIFNPKGFAYLKSDIGIKGLKKDQGFFNENKIKYLIKKILFNFFINKVDLISVESKDSLEFIKKRYPNYENKFELITNGADLSYIKKHISVKTPQEKENIIITVARIGSKVKNNEFMLEVLKQTNLKNWKMYFIGPIEKKFQENIKEFYLENPHLKKNIFFIGNITDKQELYSFYNRAKIFVLSSKTEGFPLVYSEALAFGNYIITSEVSGALDITNNNKIGKVIKQNDTKNFSLEISKIINNSNLYKDIYPKIIEHSENNFDWKNIVSILNGKLS